MTAREHVGLFRVVVLKQHVRKEILHDHVVGVSVRGQRRGDVGISSLRSSASAVRVTHMPTRSPLPSTSRALVIRSLLTRTTSAPCTVGSCDQLCCGWWEGSWPNRRRQGRAEEKRTSATFCSRARAHTAHMCPTRFTHAGMLRDASRVGAHRQAFCGSVAQSICMQQKESG